MNLPFGVYHKLRVFPEIADPHSQISISHLQGQDESRKNLGLSLKFSASPMPEYYWVGGSRISLSAGESLVINHKQLFRTEMRECGRPFLGMCINFHPKDVSEVLASFYFDNQLDYSPISLSELPEIKFGKGHAFNLYLHSILQKLLQQNGLRITGKTPFYHILEQLIFTQSSEHLKRLYRLQDLSYATRQELIRRVMQADHFMRSNLSEFQNLDIIAQQVGMSPFHFQRQYKKATGISPTRQLSIWRLNEAKNLMKSTAKDLCEIAVEVGYTDLPTFSKAFKRHFKFSPSHLRKNLKTR